jgi:long-chain acyl-CoA synthetase
MADYRGLKATCGDDSTPQSSNLLEAIKANASLEAPCLIDGATGNTVTYGQLLHEVRETARAFESKERKLAFLVAQNTVDSVLVYLALLQAGHTVCLWSAGTDTQAMQASVDLYAPHFIVGMTELRAKHYASMDALGAIPVATRSDDTKLAISHNTAILLTTSGSTGSSKLVRLSHRNIVANALSIKRYLKLTPTERAITMLPMSYSYGLSVLNSHLVSGASIVLSQEPVVSREFWQTFKTRECTSLVGVPYIHQTLLKIGIYRKPPPSLRYVTQAGGRLDPGVSREIHGSLCAHGIPFFVMYGQTEATARISFIPPDELPTRFESIGKAIPGGELSVVDECGKSCAPLQVGQLLYRGPNVMMGYAECPADLARGDELDGQLLTGDLGFYDEAGFFFLTGRMKRIAKILGMRVSLDEVEAFLAGWCPTAVVERNETIRCFYELSNHHHALEMRKELSERLGLQSDFLDFQAVEKLPRTPNGKLDYQKLAALHE